MGGFPALLANSSFEYKIKSNPEIQAILEYLRKNGVQVSGETRAYNGARKIVKGPGEPRYVALYDEDTAPNIYPNWIFFIKIHPVGWIKKIFHR